MSIISASGTGVTSILKSPGYRNRIVGQRVRFRLHGDLKTILEDFTSKKSAKAYVELIFAIRDGYIEDEDFLQLLNNVKENMYLIDKTFYQFVEALLGINWVQRSSDFVKSYQSFLLDLLSAHNYYIWTAIEKLMHIFKSAGSEEWKNDVPTEEEEIKFGHVHNFLKVLLQVVPMSYDVLIHVVTVKFPYMRRSAHEHECFVYNMLKITEYQPRLRLEFLLLIVRKMSILDIYSPRTEVEDLEKTKVNLDVEDSEIFRMETVETGEEIQQRCEGMKHPLANTLDIVMKQLFSYIHSECCNSDKEIEWERLKLLYYDIQTVFERVILTTHASNHIQFLIFYISSLRRSVAEAFLNFLWSKVVSPTVAPVVRQASVMYLSSVLARASYINVKMLKTMINEMSSWIHSYISTLDGLEYVKTNVRVHSVFYAVCQSLFYVIAFRSDLFNGKKNLLFLQSLNLGRMVTSRLNPLKFCLPVVADSFAAVTHTYQLVYCYSVMERNERSTLKVIHEDNKGIVSSGDLLETFFPFDPYYLNRSSCFIKSIYRIYEKPELLSSYPVNRHTDTDNGVGKSKNEGEEDDDFLNDIIPNSPSSNSSLSHILAYGSSPGVT